MFNQKDIKFVASRRRGSWPIGRLKKPISQPNDKWKFDLTPERIVEFRKEFDLSRKAFAEYIGVAPLTVLNWEVGNHTPDRRCMHRLAIMINSRFSPVITAQIMRSTYAMAKAMGVVMEKAAN